MYQVIDSINGNIVHSEWDSFKDALCACYEMALEQATADQVKSVDIYDNGYRGEDGIGIYDAGACPKNVSRADWPYVIFTKGE